MNRLQLTLTFTLATLLFASLSRAQDPTLQTSGPQPPPAPQSSGTEKHDGTAPRASADKYPAHVEKDGLAIGGELLAKKAVSRIFASDLNRCCLVVEVAFYPTKDEPVNLSLVDFALLKEGSDKPIRPESPTVVAAKLQKDRSPLTSGGVRPTGSVGYETGTYQDPVTGQPVHVHSVDAGVGVTKDPGIPPAVSDHDREVMEWELSSKCLQEDKASIPIAGYLYFPIPKSEKDAKYTLTYYSDAGPIVLNLH
jgi:hypothetical protein